VTVARRELLSLLLLCLSIHGCDAAPPRISNLVLITIDTLRGDHFLSERAGTPLTPRLARFAQRSVVFTHASSVSHATSPGIAGILTGLLPRRSGVIFNSNVLPERLPTLAAVLHAAGFETAAFVSNPILSTGFGFDRSFDTYERIRPEAPHAKVRGRQVTREALRWLEGVENGRRFLLWVHYMEPHGPYEPSREQLAAFPKEAFVALENIPLLPKGNNSGRGGIPFYQYKRESEPSRDGRDYTARYAAEVRAVDETVRDLLAGLEARGVLDDSVVVLTSDHGEALAGEHGFYFSHANGLTEDQIHVPLLLHYRGCDSGRRIDRPVSTLDIVPTSLDLLGLPPIDHLDGAHLLSEEGRVVVAQIDGALAIREGVWKLHATENAGYKLMNLSKDPGETRDVSAEFPDLERKMMADLRTVEGLRPLAVSEERPRHQPIRERTPDS
jgi:arylsulfatase A-like enzyme